MFFGMRALISSGLSFSKKKSWLPAMKILWVAFCFSNQLRKSRISGFVPRLETSPACIKMSVGGRFSWSCLVWVSEISSSFNGSILIKLFANDYGFNTFFRK